MVPDVVMLAVDPAVTAITFGPNAPFQTAESSMQSDGDGARHSLLLFPAGTTTSLVFADGRTEPATTLHVRATEFTVGARGPDAMPAVLPPLSGYTYCTELSGRRGDRRRRRLGRASTSRSFSTLRTSSAFRSGSRYRSGISIAGRPCGSRSRTGGS